MPELLILPKKGLSGLLFGSDFEIARSVFGEPNEVEQINSIDDKYKTTVWHYWEHGFSIFFDEDAGHTFTCAEIDNQECVLWGKKIFSFNESEIIQLFNENGFSDIDIELHEWGEKRVSFDDALVDLYFENGHLTSVNFGIISSENKSQTIIFPN